MAWFGPGNDVQPEKAKVVKAVIVVAIPTFHSHPALFLSQHHVIMMFDFLIEQKFSHCSFPCFLPIKPT